jgi:hypothetical protein
MSQRLGLLGRELEALADRLGSGSGSWAGSSRLLRIALAALKSRMKARIFISAPQNGHRSGSTS